MLGFIIKSKLNTKQKKALRHKNKLGEGAKKRKKLHGKEKVRVVMHEFKRGTLHSGSGEIVKDKKQAIAISMSEAGLSKKNKMRKSENIKLVFFKSQNLPVGTVSTLSNGQKVKKVAEGKWVPVSEGKSGNKQIEGLQLKEGFYYDGKTKITNDPEKAKQYLEKKKESGGKGEGESDKPPLKVGAKVRVKSNAKAGGVRQEGRGAIATIKEIGKDFVKLVTDTGKMFTVKQTALEMAKSIKLCFFNLFKARNLPVKYYKREGGKGKYRYWYRNEKGKIVEGRTKEDKTFTQKTNISIKDITASDIENMRKDKALRNNFIVENQKYINGVISYNHNKLIDNETKQIDYESAVQNGNLGFIEAISNFDTKESPKAFSTYLYQYILGYMKQGKSGENIQGVDRNNLIQQRYKKILNETKGNEDDEQVENIDMVEKEYKLEQQYIQEQKDKRIAAKEFIKKIKEELSQTKNKTNKDKKRISTELKVADLIFKKESGKEIADQLKISPKTVSLILKKIKNVGIKYMNEYSFKSENEINNVMSRLECMINGYNCMDKDYLIGTGKIIPFVHIHGTLVFKSELQEGIKIEKEHSDLVKKIRSQLKQYGKIKLSDEEIYKMIAQAHIREKPNYYKLLEKYIEGENKMKKSEDIKLGFFVKSISHKYIKRTGGPGNYKYWYKDSSGKKEILKDIINK